MNGTQTSGFRRDRGFTLIELLVVIAIISILAALVFPVTGAVNRAKVSKKVQSELAQVEFAIQNYKTKLGYYPPDNPGLPATNQLYYELLGTRLQNNIYTTLDESSQVRFAGASIFGPKVQGIMNTTRPGSADDAARAQKFMVELKPSQVGEMQTGERLLVCSVSWPVDNPWQWIKSPPAKALGLNPWRYNSSSPTNNPGSFDLWVDVVIGGKTNRFSNWSKRPQLVGTPW